jgi:hypothetical protein
MNLRIVDPLIEYAPSRYYQLLILMTVKVSAGRLDPINIMKSVESQLGGLVALF